MDKIDRNVRELIASFHDFAIVDDLDDEREEMLEALGNLCLDLGCEAVNNIDLARQLKIFLARIKTNLILVTWNMRGSDAKRKLEQVAKLIEQSTIVILQETKSFEFKFDDLARMIEDYPRIGLEKIAGKNNAGGFVILFDQEIVRLIDVIVKHHSLTGVFETCKSAVRFSLTNCRCPNNDDTGQKECWDELEELSVDHRSWIISGDLNATKDPSERTKPDSGDTVNMSRMIAFFQKHEFKGFELCKWSGHPFSQFTHKFSGELYSRLDRTVLRKILDDETYWSEEYIIPQIEIDLYDEGGRKIKGSESDHTPVCFSGVIIPTRGLFLALMMAVFNVSGQSIDQREKTALAIFKHLKIDDYLLWYICSRYQRQVGDGDDRGTKTADFYLCMANIETAFTQFEMYLIPPESKIYSDEISVWTDSRLKTREALLKTLEVNINGKWLDVCSIKMTKDDIVYVSEDGASSPVMRLK